LYINFGVLLYQSSLPWLQNINKLLLRTLISCCINYTVQKIRGRFFGKYTLLCPAIKAGRIKRSSLSVFRCLSHMTAAQKQCIDKLLYSPQMVAG